MPRRCWLWLVLLMTLGWGMGCVRAGPRTPVEPVPSPTPPAPGPTRRPSPTPTPTARADLAAWQRTNPGGGGAFHAVAIGPTAAFLVGSDLSGAYLSWDQGRSWQPIGAAQGLTETHVSGVGVDPADPAILYAGTEQGIFRSPDQGRSWQQVLDHGYVTDIVFAAAAPHIGYAAVHSRHDVADGAVYVSTDRGQHWRAATNAGLPSGLHILKLRVAASDPARVYALAGEGRFACGPAALFTSPDGGRTWHRLAADLGQILDFALDPHDPQRIYLSTYGDVWDPGYRCRHDDPKGGWVYVGTGPSDGPWQRISADLGARNLLLWPDAAHADALRVLDMDARELWATADGGRSWAWLSDITTWDPGWTWGYDAYGITFAGDAKAWAWHPDFPDTVVWIDSQFVWASFDGGHTFGPLHTEPAGEGGWRSRGVDNIVPFDLALDADGRHVYAALADLGCWRSPDAGASWHLCNDPAFTGDWEGRGGDSLTVLADPDRPGVVWMAQAPALDADHSLLRSDDHARTWRPVGQGLPRAILAGLSLDPHSPPTARTLFVTAGGDVYRSTDDGLTWTQVLACRGCWVTAVDPEHPGRVYAGGATGLWRSDAGGARGSWSPLGPWDWPQPGDEVIWSADWRGVAAIRFAAGQVWVAVHGPGLGVYRSDDGGETWALVLPHDHAWDVLPRANGQVWVAASSARYAGGYEPGLQGVLFSPDSGRTWQPWNHGLAWPFAVRLVGDETRLWAALPGLGYAWRPWP